MNITQNSEKNSPSISSFTDINSRTVQNEKVYRLIETRNLNDSSYIMRFDRNEMDFVPGQHITMGVHNDHQVREYSIYSPNNVPYLEVLIKEVEDGMVSKRLKKCKPGDNLNIDGPFGFFMLEKKNIESKKHLFIGTGTGISPFHAFVGSYPNLDYTILHGIRNSTEAYERNTYPKNRYIACTSRDKSGDFHGRVTDYLSKNKVDSDTLIYLCGNCDMIYEVYDLLTSGGISSDNIRTEVYF